MLPLGFPEASESAHLGNLVGGVDIIRQSRSKRKITEVQVYKQSITDTFSDCLNNKFWPGLNRNYEFLSIIGAFSSIASIYNMCFRF